ncbi:MAG: hypothetical protein LAO56_01745 [Acidobacteriia bacterium]|nr:hypothetical protein [Terriglobia bacterium]
MQRTKSIVFWFAPLLLTSLSLAQKGDWQAVKDLPPGTRISILAGHAFIRDTCFFLTATDDQLVCGRTLHGHPRIGIVFPIPNEAVYERSRVREVRLEHGEAVDALNPLIGGAIGAGVGVGIGAAAPNNGGLTRGGAALVTGTVGAVAGSVLGGVFPVVRGKVVYRR